MLCDMLLVGGAGLLEHPERLEEGRPSIWSLRVSRLLAIGSRRKKANLRPRTAKLPRLLKVNGLQARAKRASVIDSITFGSKEIRQANHL